MYWYTKSHKQLIVHVNWLFNKWWKCSINIFDFTNSYFLCFLLVSATHLPSRQPTKTTTLQLRQVETKDDNWFARPYLATKASPSGLQNSPQIIQGSCCYYWSSGCGSAHEVFPWGISPLSVLFLCPVTDLLQGVVNCKRHTSQRSLRWRTLHTPYFFYICCFLYKWSGGRVDVRPKDNWYWSIRCIVSLFWIFMWQYFGI